MSNPTYGHSIRLATQRAFEWSAHLDAVDYDDAIWEWKFREHINSQRKRYGLKVINNPKPKKEDFE